MSKFCLGCMQPKEQSPVCEHCGFDETKENLPHQLPVGTLLQNQYLVGKVLGQGGFGITYIGWDQHLSIPVAIKEYFPSGVVNRHTKLSTEVFCANGQMPEIFVKHQQRFLKEAQTLSRLSDISEIVHIRNFFAENKTAYIVMEFIQGITLKEHLKQLGRPLSEQEALAIMEPVLKALRKVHDHGLIHRDISPDNIMLPDAGGIKLIDFGTVRVADSSDASKSTEAVLKPGFAPMEQYNTRGNLGTWTDVYALCATFHYLLTGKVPPEAMERYDTGEQLELLRAREDLSPGLIPVLEKGMKVLVPERIQTVGELYDLLYQKSRTKPAPSPKKRKLWLPAAAAAVLVTAAAAWLLLPKQKAALPEQTQPEIAVTEAPEPAPTVSPETQPQTSAMHEVEIRYNEAAALEEAGEYGKAAIAFGKLGNYRDSRDRSFALWDRIAPRETLVAKGLHTLALRTDGRVCAAGSNTYGQCNVSDWTAIVALSAYDHTVGLRSDGTVLATGNNNSGQCNVSEWTDVVAVSAENVPIADSYENTGFTVGLRADGTVVATGDNSWGQCDVSGWTDVVYITTDHIYMKGATALAFGCHTVGLRTDGTVLVAGENQDGWWDSVSQWTDIITVSSGGQHILGLRSDGSVVAAGNSITGFAIMPSRLDVSGWTDISAIDTTPYLSLGIRTDGSVVLAGAHSAYDMRGAGSWTDVTMLTGSSLKIGLRSDGTARAVGYNPYNCGNISGWQDIAVISTSDFHTVAIRSDGTAIATGNNDDGQCEVSEWTDLKVPG